MSKLPERLKKLRKEKNLSQQDLSIQLNIPRTTLSSWENGSRTPELLSMQKLADFFKVPIDYLIGRTNTKNPIYTKSIVENISIVIQDDAELAEFVEKLTYRRDLHIISKKLKNLSTDSINKLIKVIDALEMDTNLED